MRGVSGERGMVLTDLMVSMTIMLVVFGATLAAFNGFERTSRANQVQNQAQDEVRVGIDRLARELRNSWIEKADGYDLVGQSVDGKLPASGNTRRRERVRYCLDSPGSGAAKLWRQVQTWTEPPTPAMAPTDACPATGWSSTLLVSEHVVNRVGGANRSVFLYDTTVPADVREVRAQLFVDVELGSRPAESRLLSGVYLRNRNRGPTASFTATPSKPGYILLNASFSTDPDEDALAYVWRDGGAEVAKAKLSATGPVAQYGPLPSGGAHQLSLLVRDPAGLEHSTPSQSVVAP